MIWRRASAIFAALAVIVVCGCAPKPIKLEFPSSPDGPALDGRLFKPDGAGPFPAVVLLPACAGPRTHVYMWAQRLRDTGYVVQLVDSLSRREVKENCRSLAVSVDDVASDALQALAHLRRLSFVNGSRVGAVGFSYGGMAALRLTSAAYARRASPLPGFRAAVAFYPHCTASDLRLSFVQDNLYDDVSTPLLMLLGAADTEAAASNCASKADALRRRDRPVSYKVYADATHGFDQGVMGWRGEPYFFNHAAVEDSWNEMRAFLELHLKR